MALSNQEKAYKQELKNKKQLDDLNRKAAKKAVERDMAARKAEK